MTVQAVFAPMFAQILLTLALMFLMAYRRTVALRSGQTRPVDIGLREPNWPKPALQAAYSFSNQFEVPVLFYILTIVAWITRHADLLFVTMAWIFVVFRIAQAFVHVTFNRVEVRGALYAIGALVLTIMWVVLIIRVMLGLP